MCNRNLILVCRSKMWEYAEFTYLQRHHREVIGMVRLEVFFATPQIFRFVSCGLNKSGLSAIGNTEQLFRVISGFCNGIGTAAL